MLMNPYRCEICGETTLFSNPPERCPYCGSLQKRVVAAAEWINYGKVEMSEQSYKDCEKALSLELNNYAYYKCSAAKAGNQLMESAFLRLMKQEYEHAELIADAMGIPLPEPPVLTCSDSDFENMEESNKHETMAISFYTEVATRATEPRLKEIFRALAEVENAHLMLTNVYIQK